ncbi:hypothetical protein PMG11_05113 [Penicillium brasilianum]|uniref:Nuclear membrane fusion protein Kar5 n=1 Tax=Penicillium brasilianum TaxID=104259 RepID=A0A0F7VEJ2_PENBI|nr:hypothetical protein PMG11_05113 [Penicillium brasilianum]
MKWLTSRFPVSAICGALTWSMMISAELQASEYETPHLPTAGIYGSNAVTYLTSNTRQPDSIFSEAVQLLESMSASPSCNRVAATRLVTSCQDLGGKGNTDPERNQALDVIRSIYAARLAICELEGTGAVIPQPCVSVTVPIPSPSNSGFKFFRRSKSMDCDETLLPKKDLEQCLRSLESRPQWWTSYSNNRQNAMIICQASRIEAEKEEMLNLHQSLAKNTVKLDEGLQEALRQAAETSAEHQAFLLTVQALQKRLSREMEERGSLLRGLFGKFLNDIEAGFDIVASAVSSALGKVQMETSLLSQNIQNTSSEIHVLQQVLRATSEETVARSHQALRVQQENSLVAKELTLDLHSSLRSLAETDVAQLSRQMANVDVALEWLISRLTVALEQESKLTERLQAMDASMHQAQTKADELQRAQSIQIEALAVQQQIQEAIRYDTQVSQALLDRATTTAANLHTIIDEAAVKFKQAPGLHQGGLSIWTVCLMLVIVVGAQNFKAAFGLTFFIFGHLIATTAFPFFKSYGSSMLAV